ncbi:hypothetical protein GHK69_18735 [Sinorhizobium meliloti]|nr:hypothetical protein [Sinorhizobium meliloti]
MGSAITIGQNLEALTAEQVLAAVEHRLSLSATSGSRTAATSHIRTFLRFILGWSPSPRSRPRCPKDALLAFGTFAAAPCMA